MPSEAALRAAERLRGATITSVEDAANIIDAEFVDVRLALETGIAEVTNHVDGHTAQFQIAARMMREALAKVRTNA